ncbi:MAG: hypothetical protein R2762_18800 [Bryobacteraceae bacterium]
MRFQIRLYVTAVLASMLLLTAVPAEASVLGTYNDRATWEGVTTGRVDFDFDTLGLSPGGFTQYNSAAGLTIGDVNFVGYQHGGYSLTALNPLAGWDENFGSGALLRGPYYFTDSYLLVTFTTSITSFALDLMTMSPDAGDFEIIVDGVSLGVVTTANRPTHTFFGVQTDTPITQVRIQLASGNLTATQGLFDNVAIGLANTGGGGGQPPPGETPEVSTMFYTAMGFGLVYWSRRRLPRQRPTPVLA